MNIIDAMKSRHSVRSYNGQPLSATASAALIDAIASAESPFGGGVTIRLAHFDLKGYRKPWTYGMISGACSFLLMAVGQEDCSMLSAGFMMERVILEATAMGLGTCWMAATFRGTDFDRGQEWPDGQRLRVVVPVGIPSSRPGLVERFTRFTLGSRTRKPFSDLFFNGNFETHLAYADSAFAPALEMMRIAPSSVNSQPWRAVESGDTVHFYHKTGSSLSLLDCGIGISHFDAAEREAGCDGCYFTASDVSNIGGLDYVVSYKRQN